MNRYMYLFSRFYPFEAAVCVPPLNMSGSAPTSQVGHFSRLSHLVGFSTCSLEHENNLKEQDLGMLK